jgi:hypothetical protein
METSTDIVIIGTGTDGNIVVEPGEGQEEGTDPGFDIGEGTVLRLMGIVCTDATTPQTPTAPDCPAGTDEVEVIFSTDDNTSETFTIAEEDFQVRYAVEQAPETENGTFELSVLRRGDTVEQSGAVTGTVTDGLLEVDDAGPGTFRLVVVDQDVVFAITVCEGGGGGGGAGGDGADDKQYDDGDVDDPDDVVPGTGDDDPLPDTGGAPLLFGAAALALAAALLARRILAP